MKKGYFAVWFGPEDGQFKTTDLFPSSGTLRKKIDFFEDPIAEGHVVIFFSNGQVFYPVEESWMPVSIPKLNWRGYQTPE